MIKNKKKDNRYQRIIREYKLEKTYAIIFGVCVMVLPVLGYFLHHGHFITKGSRDLFYIYAVAPFLISCFVSVYRCFLLKDKYDKATIIEKLYKED